MNWSYASHPDPEISLSWRDVRWPPSEWCDMPDIALGKVEAFWQFDEPKSARALVSRMTEEQLMLWAVSNMVGQVCNGGFAQAFFNSYGELAEESVVGVAMFGMKRHAEIFEEALTLFGMRPIPRERDARIKHLKLLAKIDGPERISPSYTDCFAEIALEARTLWGGLQSEFFKLLAAKTHGDGYEAAFYRPLAEWIYAHRHRFFVD